jgi:hypothetical protein
MGKHSVTPVQAGKYRRTGPAPFLLAPLLLVAAIVAALTIVASSGQAQQSRLRIDPVSPAPAASGAAGVKGPANSASASAAGGGSAGTKAKTPKSPSPSGRVSVALLGAPDFAGYCAATGQGGVRLKADNAYGWRCTSDNGTGADAQAVCAWTYHIRTVTNRVADFNDPGSWQCWRANRRLGAVDFAAYCEKKGHPGASYVDGAYAYGWYCTGAGGGIDTQDACRRLYGTRTPVSRFSDFYDKNSWECWA